MGDVLQHQLVGNHMLKNVAFVDKICQPSAAWFLLEFGARVLAFLLKELIDPLVQFGKERLGNCCGQDDEANVIELLERLSHGAAPLFRPIDAIAASPTPSLTSSRSTTSRQRFADG